MVHLQRQCLRIPIRTGQTEHLAQWVRTLNDRMTEVTAALAKEGIVAEAVFLERGATGTFLILYTAAPDLIAANVAFQASTEPVDVEFRQLMMETLDLQAATMLDVLFSVP